MSFTCLILRCLRCAYEEEVRSLVGNTSLGVLVFVVATLAPGTTTTTTTAAATTLLLYLLN